MPRLGTEVIEWLGWCRVCVCTMWWSLAPSRSSRGLPPPRPRTRSPGGSAGAISSASSSPSGVQSRWKNFLIIVVEDLQTSTCQPHVRIETEISCRLLFYWHDFLAYIHIRGFLVGFGVCYFLRFVFYLIFPKIFFFLLMFAFFLQPIRVFFFIETVPVIEPSEGWFYG
jgi:hypothetical protein